MVISAVSGSRSGGSAIVFVWEPRGTNIGHASLALNDGTYVSWWPGGAGAMSSSMTEDKQQEGQIPDWASAPIRGLDEAAMSAAWREISGRMPGWRPDRRDVKSATGEYDFAINNCSDMVLNILKAGGLLTRYPATRSLAAIVVTPLLIKRIAIAATNTAENYIYQMIEDQDAYLKQLDYPPVMIRAVVNNLLKGLKTSMAGLVAD